MQSQRWSILLVDDDQDDFILTQEKFNQPDGRSQYHLDWASNYEDGLTKILSGKYDAILMDYSLGEKTGLDLTREITRQGCRTPVILLTGRGNYAVDLAAMQVGVTEYLAKSDATYLVLDRAIRYAILQKQTEEDLRRAKEELETRVKERTSLLTVQNEALAAEIQERMRVQRELNEVQRQLIDRDEAERLEIARDIHDGPMQELYGLVFQLDTFRSDIETGKGDEVIEEVKAKLLQVIQSLRHLSRDLRPPALAPYGLEKAIRSHAENFQQVHGELQIELELEKDGRRLPESIRLALYRIYQTMINNVARHAQATRVTVQLRLETEQAVLEIKDDGRGFVVPRRWYEFARQGHLGLVGAAERAEVLGGKLEVKSALGEGTQVRVTVPRNEVTKATVLQ